MYSENNRRASGMRANDEFLRRMLGGDLTGGEVPAMSKDPMEQNYSLERDGDDGHRGGSMGERGNARFSNEQNGKTCRFQELCHSLHQETICRCF